MKKIGLALSGGGFRASLYHLGLVRFLRDAGILSQVTHITSVSGGSIFAAHLVLNWDRYNGSASEFDAAASEFLSFVRLDVRNRISRRFLLTLPLRWPRQLLGRSNRKLTRTGLLEYHYEQYLYGDKSLFELPEKPQLHLLATNLSEGCLCSFNRNGLLMVRRQPGNTFRVDRIHIGLATVAMAVTASSAFPGFFPPVELTGAQVGTSAGEFGRQAYTDGGVFDNLGVRMFRCLERSLLADSPLSRDDFIDFRVVVEALREASQSVAETPLCRLAQVLVVPCGRPDPLLLRNVGSSSNVLTPSSLTSNGAGEELVLSRLWDVMRQYQFQLDPLFVSLKPVQPDAELLLHTSRLGSRVLDTGDQLRLNRHLLEAAFRQATGHACFRRLDSGLDGVLVSDVGKRIEVRGNRRAGGLIRTALRATDILMDRVWQLEYETFQDTPGFVFAPITEVVEPAEDPTALHPEIQRQAANIRTDLDRFSLLEISSLVRHGYCVGRKTCRARPDLFGADLPANPPWDPIPGPRGAAPSVPVATHLDGPCREPTAPTAEARTLQASALRRIWSTFLDYRDWASYVYVPLLVPLLVLLPYFVFKSYQRSQRNQQLVDSLYRGTKDLLTVNRLLETKAVPWTSGSCAIPEGVPELEEVNLKGFEILQDSHIFDLRSWRPETFSGADVTSLVVNHRRLYVLKQSVSKGNDLLHVPMLPTHDDVLVRFPAQQLSPKLRKTKDVPTSIPGVKECRWEAVYDFKEVPAGDAVEISYVYQSPGRNLESGAMSSTMTIPIRIDTAELTVWILMPEGKPYESFRISRYLVGKPETLEHVKLYTEYLPGDFTILDIRMLAVKAGYIYSLSWNYK